MTVRGYATWPRGSVPPSTCAAGFDRIDGRDPAVRVLTVTHESRRAGRAPYAIGIGGETSRRRRRWRSRQPVDARRRTTASKILELRAAADATVVARFEAAGRDRRQALNRTSSRWDPRRIPRSAAQSVGRDAPREDRGARPSPWPRGWCRSYSGPTGRLDPPPAAFPARRGMKPSWPSRATAFWRLRPRSIRSDPSRGPFKTRRSRCR